MAKSSKVGRPTGGKWQTPPRHYRGGIGIGYTKVKVGQKPQWCYLCGASHDYHPQEGEYT